MHVKNKESFLLHIFDVEWMHRKQQVNAFIAHILKCNQTLVDAHQCVFSNVNEQDAVSFYDENAFIFHKTSQFTYGLKYNNMLMLCIQGDIIDECLVLHDIWMKIGIDVQNAFECIIKTLQSTYKKIKIVIDRRLWPSSMLDGISIALLDATPPNVKYAVRNPNWCLVDELDEENAKTMHYTIYDSGSLVALIDASKI